MTHQELSHFFLWFGYRAAEIEDTHSIDVANVCVRASADHLLKSGRTERMTLNGVKLSRMVQSASYFKERSTLLADYSDLCYKVGSWMSETCEDLFQKRVDAFDAWADNPTSKELAAKTLCLSDSASFANMLFKDTSDKGLLHLNGRIGLEIAIKFLSMLEEA